MKKGEGTQFGLPNKKEIHDGYIGKWVIISPSNRQNNTYAGILSEIKEEYAFLKPYQTGEWDAEKGLMRKLSDEIEELKEEKEMVFLPGANIEPTTRKNIESCNTYQNSQIEKNYQNNPKQKAKD